MPLQAIKPDRFNADPNELPNSAIPFKEFSKTTPRNKAEQSPPTTPVSAKTST